MTKFQYSRKNGEQLLFEVQLNWISRNRGVVSAKDVPEGIRISSSSRFGDLGRGWSGEHLLLAAVNSCFMSTFLSYANRNGFDVETYDCTVIGHLSPVANHYEFSQVDLYPEIRIAENVSKERLMLALQYAQKHSVVFQSLQAEKVLHPRIIQKRLSLSNAVEE